MSVHQQPPQQWPPQQWAPPPPHPHRKKSSTGKTMIIVGAVVLAVGVVAIAGLALLGAALQQGSGEAAQPVATAAAAVPSPDAGQAAAYLAALERIDPGLVANEARAIRRGRSICDRIINPSGGTMTLEEYVVAELSGGNATIDEAQARQVIRAVKVWCPAGS